MNRYCMWSLLVVVLLAGTSKETFIKKAATMKMNAGIITPHLQASRDFYSRVLEFGVVFESEWYILMHSPGGQSQLAFLQPEHPSQDTLFRPAYAGEGVFLTIEVPDVDAVYERIKKMGVPVRIPIRDEAWGDRHFAIVDPNGVGIDIVTYTDPAN